MAKSEVRCETQRCIEAIEKYGAHYHSVHEQKNGTQLCARCGAIRKDGVWGKTCEECKQPTDELFGLFVPHRCKACNDKLRDQQQRAGNECTMCHRLRMECCC